MINFKLFYASCVKGDIYHFFTNKEHDKIMKRKNIGEKTMIWFDKIDDARKAVMDIDENPALTHEQQDMQLAGKACKTLPCKQNPLL